MTKETKGFSSGRLAMQWLTEGQGAAKSDAQLNAEISEVRNEYEEKQERKRERLAMAAVRASAHAESAFGTSRRVLDAIPFGQPILVGHHSERRHRSDIEKSDRAMRRGVEESKRADELARRAAAVGTGGVSSDDPEAVRKLGSELDKLKESQAQMKATNATIRKYAKAGAEAQVQAIVSQGFLTERMARKILEPDFMGRVGFADYQITNNGSNIRRIEKRITELTARREQAAAIESDPSLGRPDVTGNTEGLTFRISDNHPSNRTQITFSGKPSAELRAKLKGGGFRWAPSENAWQRQISNGAWYHAKAALGIRQ